VSDPIESRGLWPPVGTWHLVGIGGIGVSAVARLLKARGVDVQGSDVRESQITRALRDEGIRVHIGHSASNIDGVAVVVASTAIPATNPELVAAAERSIPVLHRSEALGALVGERFSVGVIGTHGKGTVSGAITWLLESAGLTPGFVIGGLLHNWGTNARPGSPDAQGRHWLVAEVDESDGSLVNSQPVVAVLNNLELDHLHYYPEWPKLEAAVLQYFHSNPRLKTAVINADDPGCQKILGKLQLKDPIHLVTFGFGDDCKVRGRNLVCGRMHGAFDVEMRCEDGSYEPLGHVEIRLPGAYNASNLLGAIAVAWSQRLDFATIQRGAPLYLGLENRFTLVDAAGVEVVKDYISHPTGIQRVLEAARAQALGPITAVFKPYRFTMIHYLMDDYRKAFRDADQVVVTELYTAGEVPIPGTDVHVLCEKIREVTPNVTYVHDLNAIPEWLHANVQAPASVLFFGGDDLFQIADRYAGQRIAGQGGAEGSQP
jgi:UDP-N-acetylmuramate--alanine ligase